MEPVNDSDSKSEVYSRSFGSNCDLIGIDIDIATDMNDQSRRITVGSDICIFILTEELGISVMIQNDRWRAEGAKRQNFTLCMYSTYVSMA